ncbi:bacteriophage protein [Burkholderia multivorans ATCC 17616]|uniref:Bacteriophage protein n=1 Tax=Burkholderia multivorans (strain ATCC 17616 / 249) TaxID=395019 RepID=A0A0H3KN96_BURM1|nr:gp30 [Burkholderia phage Bcep176]ABA60031.1 gp30 [Burkholderia phage Bcep176]BAG46518.1 bacteriophage protein [Burkholderia multivorans ATCC 17616]
MRTHRRSTASYAFGRTGGIGSRFPGISVGIGVVGTWWLRPVMLFIGRFLQKTG